MENIRKKSDKNNIDFDDLKNKLNNIYDDSKLTSNTINHIKATHGSSREIQWETGTKNKVIEKINGVDKEVDLSNGILKRAKKGDNTLWISHNHTSGTPLPHAEDIKNMIKYNITNSSIPGNYGHLNMKNSFKASKKDFIKIESKANEMFDNLRKEAFKNNPYVKYESDKVRN